MHCPDCERIDDLVFEQTRFWFHTPTGEGFSKIAALCGRQGIGAEQVSDRCISFSLPGAKVPDFFTALYGALASQELRHIRVVTTSGAEPGVMDLGRIVTADVLVNRIRGQWIVESIRQQKFESWFQPIVSARDPDEVYGAEALFRLRDDTGNTIPPAHVFEVADHADLLFSVDLVARENAVRTAAKAGFRGKIFINFNPSSIYDPAYCLRTTAATIADLGLKPSDIVFEITETEQITDVDHLKGILTFYRRAGFTVALDDIGAGWSGLNIFHTFSPDLIKLDMDLVRGLDRDEFKASIVRHLVAMAHDNGIKVVGEGVETEAEARALREYEVDYLQGFLFAKPAPISEFMQARAA